MKLAGFDVETRGTEEGYGLQPFRARTDEAWITMCAIASSKGVVGKQFCRTDPAVRRTEIIAFVAPWLRKCAEKDITIVGWNTPFDMAWLIALGLRDEVYACRWLDGMLLWKHLTASPEWTQIAPKSYGLKAAVGEYFPLEAGYEHGIDFDTDDPALLTELLEYNKKDARFSLELAELFWSKLTPTQCRGALIEAACLPMVADALVEGIVMNRDMADELSRELLDEANVALVTLKLNTREDISAKTLASPMQLRELLFMKWLLPIVKLTANGQPSTDRDALSLLADGDPRPRWVNEHREAVGNRTKFAEGTINSVNYNGDGRARPNARVFSAYTGRMTYSSSILRGVHQKPTGVALHQWKRTPEFRRLIEAPEGYTLMEFDFSGQEFRWMAVLSGDRTMTEMCRPGEDAHAFMGAKIGQQKYSTLMQDLLAGDPKAKKLRQLGKVGNLSCQYRTGAETLTRVARVGYNLPLTMREARAIHGTYRTTYPLVLEYWKNQIKKARMDGYVETIAGRRVWLSTGDTWKLGASGDAWGRESAAINAPIQGSGADQKYLALAILRNYLPKVDGRFYFELHDGIFIIVPDRYAETTVRELKQLLSNLPYKRAWGVDLPVAFPVDAKMGKNWGDLVEIKE